jgi:hypothetical protein
MSWMGIMPTWAKTPEICMTCYDSHSASVAHSLSICPHVRGPSPAPSIGPAGIDDVGLAGAPLPVSPPAPLGPFPVGREGSGIPPTSGHGR